MYYVLEATSEVTAPTGAKQTVADMRTELTTRGAGHGPWTWPTCLVRSNSQH